MTNLFEGIEQPNKNQRGQLVDFDSQITSGQGGLTRSFTSGLKIELAVERRVSGLDGPDFNVLLRAVVWGVVGEDRHSVKGTVILRVIKPTASFHSTLISSDVSSQRKIQKGRVRIVESV